MKKILIADDEKRIRLLLSDFLSMEGYKILQAKDGLEALEIFRNSEDIELLILDVMMPNINGWDLCKEIRRTSNIPIIMLTAKNTEPDELAGFIYGADEYITKPFSPTILVARVNALYKRTYGEGRRTCVTYGLLHIDRDGLTVDVDSERISLSSMEFKLLEYFVLNKDIVLSRDMLLDNVWGSDYTGTDRTVDTHINRLRVKLGKAGGYIDTVRGIGYRFQVSK